MAHDGTLTIRQEKALTALLSESSIREAATLCKIPERTLWRWLRETPFAEAYQRLRRDTLAQSTTKLQQASGAAAACLVDTLKDAAAPYSARVTAAKLVLDFAYRAVELEDVQNRVGRLERALIAMANADEEEDE